MRKSSIPALKESLDAFLLHRRSLLSVCASETLVPRSSASPRFWRDLGYALGSFAGLAADASSTEVSP